jgi:toxin ParE1/3/4
VAGEARLVLTPTAEQDLTEIWTCSARQWSQAQADIYLTGLFDAFDLLRRFPELARPRAEFRPPVRIHRHAGHLILYLYDEAVVTIVRVRSVRENWRAALDEA